MKQFGYIFLREREVAKAVNLTVIEPHVLYS